MRDHSDKYGSYPMNMKRKQAVVIKAPLLDGDSMPNIATTVAHAHTHNKYIFLKGIKSYLLLLSESTEH